MKKTLQPSENKRVTRIHFCIIHICIHHIFFVLLRSHSCMMRLHIPFARLFNFNHNKITTMKKTNILWLFVSLFLLAVPAVQTYASGDEVEIELMEVSSFLPGDNPFDGPTEEGDVPPQPTDFRATIAGSTLAITSGTHSARVIVRDNTGTSVLDRQFVGGTMEQLSTPGNYSLEINSGSLTLVGVFAAQ